MGEPIGVAVADPQPDGPVVAGRGDDCAPARQVELADTVERGLVTREAHVRRDRPSPRGVNPPGRGGLVDHLPGAEGGGSELPQPGPVCRRRGKQRVPCPDDTCDGGRDDPSAEQCAQGVRGHSVRVQLVEYASVVGQRVPLIGIGDVPTQVPDQVRQPPGSARRTRAAATSSRAAAAWAGSPW